MPFEVSSETRSTSQKIGLLLGPILFFVTLFLDLDPSNPEVTHMAAVAVLMATWWITDAIPLSAIAPSSITPNFPRVSPRSAPAI